MTVNSLFDSIVGTNRKRFLNSTILMMVFVVTIIALSLGITGFSDDSDAEIGETFVEDGIKYKVIDEFGVEVVSNDTFYSGYIIIPAKVNWNIYDVVSIGDNAFYGCTSLASVTIPSSVTSIGEFAFCGCTILSNVTIPDSVKSLGASAFYGCEHLISVEISKGLTSLSDSVFSNCPLLSSVTIPNGIVSIGSEAFYKCTKLTSATIPDSVTSIGQFSFAESGLESVTVSDKVTSLGNSAFFKCEGLKSVILGKGITSFGSSVFKDCSNIDSVDIHKGLTSLGEYVFSGCWNLNEVAIPDTVTSIGNRAFNNCSTLWKLTMSDNVTYIGSGAFAGCEILDTFVMPEKVASIEDSTFFGCRSLANVTLSNNITSIGSAAFEGCSVLSILDIPGKVTVIKDSAFKDSGIRMIMVPDSVIIFGNSVFKGCRVLQSAFIGSGVTSLGKDTFNGCELLELAVIGSGVTSIGDDAFKDCGSLTRVIFGSSTPIALSADVFDDCPAGLRIFVTFASNSAYKTAWPTLATKIYSYIPEPVAAEGLVYTGSDITGVPAPAYGEYTITGNVKTSAGNYTASVTPNEYFMWIDETSVTKNITWSISKKEVVVSGIKANDKQYDKTADVTFNCDSAVFGGLVGGDTLSITVVGTFADVNVGTNKTVNITDLTLGGASVSNYVLASDGQQTTSMASISKAPITVSGIKANDKVYDRKADVTFVTSEAVLAGLFSGDTIYVVAAGAFADVNVGIDKTVNITKLTLGGTSVNNYKLADEGQQTTATASISQKEITVSKIYANGKVYDGTLDATLDFSEVKFAGLISGDSLSVTAEGSFENANAGDFKRVNITNLTLGGTSVDNYKLADEGQQTATTSRISKAPITVSGIIAQDKDYDGTAAVSFDYSDVEFAGLIGKDSLKITAEGSFDNANVGTNKTVSITKLTLGGKSIDNYKLAKEGQQTTAIASISKAPITVSGIKANDKVYDRKADVTLVYDEVVFTGLIIGDSLSVTATGAFADMNVGINKTVNITDLTLGGASISCYTLASDGQQTTATATISKASITVSGIKANDKVYDRSADVTFVYDEVKFAGLISGDSLSVTAEGSFENANVGIDKTVNITDLTLGGASVSNYKLADEGQQTVTKASISQKEIIIDGITAQDRPYDGTKSVTLVYDSVTFSGLISGDSLSVTATGSFYNANVGTDKTVGITGITLGGVSLVNYELAESGQQTTATATISKAPITVSGIKANDKVYDRKADVTLVYDEVVFTGLITGDSLSVTATGAFDDVNACTDKTVSITGITLGGVSLVNYELAESGQQTTAIATISKAPITVSGIKANDKVYDRKADVTLAYDEVKFAGLITGDSLSVTATGSFDNANVGTDKKVGIIGLTLGGASISNYMITSDGQQTTATASISKAPITVSGIKANDKVYDRKADVTLAYDEVVFTGLIIGDSLSVTATGAFDDVNAGTEKAVNITGLTLGGASVSNYKLADEGQQTTATAMISQKEITASGIIAEDKIYDRAADVTFVYDEVVFTGLISGDSLSVTATGSFDNANVGIDKTVSITGIILGGASAVNYKLADEGQQTTATATISKAPITVSGIIAQDKVYDGTVSASLDYDESVFTGLITGDSLSVAAVGAFSDANAGTEKIVIITGLTLGGPSISNYELADKGQQSFAKASIEPMSVFGADVKLGPSLTYSGKEQIQTVDSVTVSGFNVTYTVADNAVINAGTYELKVIGNGNFTGETSKQFIVAKAANKVSIEKSSSCEGMTYNVWAEAYGDPEFRYAIITGSEFASVDAEGIITAKAIGQATLKITVSEQVNYLSASDTFVIDVHDHTIVLKVGRIPTATEPGLTDGHVCLECGKVFEEQKEIPATGSSSATMATDLNDSMYEIPDSSELSGLNFILNSSHGDSRTVISLTGASVESVKDTIVYLSSEKVNGYEDRFSITVKVNNEGFNGEMYITLPYDPVKGMPSVKWIEGEESMKVVSINNDNTVTFVTTHNSTYQIEYQKGITSPNVSFCLWVVVAVLGVILFGAMIVRSRP